MTKAYDELNQCRGKVPYVSIAEARAALREASRHTVGKLNLYACPHCTYWHLGHKPPKKQQRSNRRRARR